jgi:hypothetical protein
MFNKSFYIDNSTSVRFPDTIVEKRAPTDESVKLLNEMQEKAKENIVKSVVIDSNELKIVGFVYGGGMSLGRLDHDYHVRFILNGKEYNFKDSFHYTSQDDFYMLIFEKFSKAIMLELIKDNLLNH